MFFAFSKLLNFIIDPLFLILLALFTAVICWKGNKWIQGALFLLALVGYLCGTGIVSNRMMRSLETCCPASKLQPRYDAIIVLSGMLDEL